MIGAAISRMSSVSRKGMPTSDIRIMLSWRGFGGNFRTSSIGKAVGPFIFSFLSKGKLNTTIQETAQAEDAKDAEEVRRKTNLDFPLRTSASFASFALRVCGNGFAVI